MDKSPEHLVAHARELNARYDYARALSEAETALGAIERTPGGCSLQGEAYYLAGEAAYFLAEYPLAQEYLNHAAECYTALNEMERVALCQVMLAECSARQGDVRRAKHMSQQLLEQATREGWRHLAGRVLTCLGSVAWMEGKYAAAQDSLTQAVAIHTELDEPVFVYLARISLAVALIKEERHGEAALVLEDCLRFFLSINDSLHAVHCLNNLAGISFHNGDLERARENLLQCTELQAEMHHRGDLGVSWYNLGMIEARLDNPKLARKYLHRSYQVAQETGDRMAEGSALLQLALVALHEGQAAEALNFANLAQIPLNNAPAPNVKFLTAQLPAFNLACGNTALAQELWTGVSAIDDTDAIDSLHEILSLICDPELPLYTQLKEADRVLASEWLAEISWKIAQNT